MDSIQKISYNYNGKNISSDAWALSIAQYTEKIGLKKVFTVLNSNALEFNKVGPKTKYSKWYVSYQQIIWFMKWYSNPTDISRTQNDPFIKEVTWETVPSQSTFSRINTSYNEEDEAKLEDINKHIISKYLWYQVEKNNGQKLEKLDISDDSTKIVTHGKQEWWEYIYHYWVTWYGYV